MLYRLYLSTGNGDSPARGDSYQRRRADAALLLAERIAYDVIASNGGLDTAQGWKIIHAVRALDPHHGGEVAMYGRRLYLTPSRS